MCVRRVLRNNDLLSQFFSRQMFSAPTAAIPIVKKKWNFLIFSLRRFFRYYYDKLSTPFIHLLLFVTDRRISFFVESVYFHWTNSLHQSIQNVSTFKSVITYSWFERMSLRMGCEWMTSHSVKGIKIVLLKYRTEKCDFGDWTM